VTAATRAAAPQSEALTASARGSALARAIAIQVCLLLLTLGGIEAFLRIADFRDLRLIPGQYKLPNEHDPELGWVPIANKTVPQGVGPLSFGVSLNSLGLRDIELIPSNAPTILFVGDSFVYGNGVAVQHRFTDRLRQELPAFRIVNGGVAPYSTDQEFLLLKRLWPIIKPSIVVLIVCVDNDHEENSTNSVHGYTLKPYLARVDGQWQFQGLPVPHSHRYYYDNNWLAHEFALARLAIDVYMHVRYPRVRVPDPTATLVGMMRDFVESHEAKFLVGLQHHDAALEPFLASERIPYTRFDDAATIPNDGHWNAQGHATVAQRLLKLLTDERVVVPETLGTAANRY